MKKSVIALSLFASAVLINAQKIQQKDIPAAVQKSFQKQYPTVKDVKWEKEKGNYEAGFKVNGTETSLLINASGKVLEVEKEISATSLSAPIHAYIAKHYPGEKVKDAAKITDANNVVTYEAEVKGKDLIFDSQGKFLRETHD